MSWFIHSFFHLAEVEGKLTSEKEDEKKKVMESEIKELTELVPDIDSKVCAHTTSAIYCAA